MTTKAPQAIFDNPLWKEATWLVEYMYDQLELLSEFPDERLNTESKIRYAANDVLQYLSQAVSSLMPAGSEYDWNSAHKSLFTLRSMYIFATKQKFFELEPEIVIRIDKLLDQVKAAFQVAQKATQEKDK